MTEVRLRLYVSGRTDRSEAALDTLRAIVDTHLPQGATIEVVDVLEQPEAAEQHHIRVTPTLDKVLPMPTKRIVGELTDAAAVLEGLGLAAGRGVTPDD